MDGSGDSGFGRAVSDFRSESYAFLARRTCATREDGLIPISEISSALAARSCIALAAAVLMLTILPYKAQVVSTNLAQIFLLDPNSVLKLPQRIIQLLLVSLNIR